MARVLYISYTGLLDPLGASQVLQYVLALAAKHEMSLLTFERKEALADAAALAVVEEKCRAAGIDWTRLEHRKGPGPLKFLDIVKGRRTATRIAREKGVEVVHCRSYLAGLMGTAVKRRTAARYIFDMRGFWPDERVEGGIWKAGGLPYRIFKRVERHLFLRADHVVSLTHAGVREFSKFDYLKGRMPPVSVIPTCTNLELFSPAAAAGPGFTLGYVGSVGSWYMFDEVAKAVSILLESRGDARFKVINKGGHDLIRETLERHDVDMSRVEIGAVPYDRVGREIAGMHAGIFFIKPVWSKRASCPTRMGEFLACGKPCLANGPVGDVVEDLESSHTGVVVTRFDEARLTRALEKLQLLAAEDGIAQRCRNFAEQKFSLEVGVAAYDAIYEALGTGRTVP